MLLGDVNFALVPVTNANPSLYVFRTTIKNATQFVRPAVPADAGKAIIIPNELIVRLKPGAKIDELAKLLGAKVIGRIDSLNAYRLQFEDAAATEAARTQLSSNPEVTSVESNFALDRPADPRISGSVNAAPLNLQLKPPPADGRIIVGVVDTAMQPLCGDLNQFLLKPISVAGTAQLEPGVPSHGTAMAETLLRSVQSMTKGSTAVQILPVDVYGPNTSTSTFDVANGVVQAVNGGARIINMSLGSQGDSPILRTVLQDAKKQNIPVFAAAGNEPVTTPFYPAAYPEVTAVTRLTRAKSPATPTTAVSSRSAPPAPASCAMTGRTTSSWAPLPPRLSPAALPPATWIPRKTASPRCKASCRPASASKRRRASDRAPKGLSCHADH